MFTKEQINKYVAASYKIACEHGFHDEEKSNAHWMMLAISEVAEMVEADRKNRHATYSAVDYCEKHPEDINTESRMRYFERDVKNSLEDELADVCIRIFDFLGEKGIEPVIFDDKNDAWDRLYDRMTVCEQCYQLVQFISGIENDSVSYIAQFAGVVLLFCCDFAEAHDINLIWHIEHKMEYNKHRAHKHGKNY